MVVRILRRPMGERADAPTRPVLLEAYAARVRRVEGEIQLIELGGADRESELAPVLAPQAESKHRRPDAGVGGDP